MKTCVAAVCGMFMLLVSCSGSREFKPAFNQPLQPVMQPGFVYVDQVAPLVKTNLKYAGYDNFVGRPLDGYHGRRAILRTQAAQALKKVSEDLYRQGYLLEIYDAYRPHTAVLDICKWGADDGDQKMKSRYYPHIDKAKVFGDHYVRDFSEHSRGVAVDVSLLYAKTGKPVDMGGHHDLLDPSSTTDSTLVTPSQRRNRMILKTDFEKQGFANYAPEWWHYRLLNEPEPTLHYYFPVWDGMTSAGRP